MKLTLERTDEGFSESYTGEDGLQKDLPLYRSERDAQTLWHIWIRIP